MHGGRSVKGILRGPSHEQGGILIEAEGKEGIFSGREMSNLGRENFYRLKDLLRTPVEDGLFNAQAEQVVSVMKPEEKKPRKNQTLEELRKLQRIVQDKREVNIDVDGLGNLIVTTVEKGMKEIIEVKLRKPRII